MGDDKIIQLLYAMPVQQRYQHGVARPVFAAVYQQRPSARQQEEYGGPVVHVRGYNGQLRRFRRAHYPQFHVQRPSAGQVELQGPLALRQFQYAAAAELYFHRLLLVGGGGGGKGYFSAIGGD